MVVRVMRSLSAIVATAPMPAGQPECRRRRQLGPQAPGEGAGQAQERPAGDPTKEEAAAIIEAAATLPDPWRCH